MRILREVQNLAINQEHVPTRVHGSPTPHLPLKAVEAVRKKHQCSKKQDFYGPNPKGRWNSAYVLRIDEPVEAKKPNTKNRCGKRGHHFHSTLNSFRVFPLGIPASNRVVDEDFTCLRIPAISLIALGQCRIFALFPDRHVPIVRQIALEVNQHIGGRTELAWFYESVGFGGAKAIGLLTGRPFLRRESENSRRFAFQGVSAGARAAFHRALAPQTPHLAPRENPCKQGVKQKNPATSRWRGSLSTGRYGSSVPLTKAPETGLEPVTCRLTAGCSTN